MTQNEVFFLLFVVVIIVAVVTIEVLDSRANKYWKMYLDERFKRNLLENIIDLQEGKQTTVFTHQHNRKATKNNMMARING